MEKFYMVSGDRTRVEEIFFVGTVMFLGCGKLGFRMIRLDKIEEEYLFDIWEEAEFYTSLNDAEARLHEFTKRQGA